jgi:CRP/FNR family transcriptional regulator, cyclic AMP receptor protein
MASSRRERLVSNGEPALRQRLRPQASYCYLLDADADLAQEFDLRMRVVARQVTTVVVFEIPVGEHRPLDWLERDIGGLGLLLLDGVIAVEVQVGDRTATELMGGGDLLQPPDRGGDDLLAHRDRWHVLVPARVAVLDAAFAERVRPWPQIALALLRRAGKRAADLDVQRAIACQPRLEVRLALMLWHLATRWGRVEMGGIRLSLPLTHKLLGQLVGAERPSVSHALARLAEAELVTGRGDEWHLHGTLEQHLACLADRAGHEPATSPAPETTRQA